MTCPPLATCLLDEKIVYATCLCALPPAALLTAHIAPFSPADFVDSKMKHVAAYLLAQMGGKDSPKAAVSENL